MTRHSITVTVNGAKEYLDVPSNMTLLQMLREELALTGTKNGCAAGECGACTVLINGEPVNACLILAVEADGTKRCPMWILYAGNAHLGAGATEPKRPPDRSRDP